MAKVSKIAREKRITAGMNLDVRRRLKAMLVHVETSAEDKVAISEKLQKRPRNESRIRGVRRCNLCGRPKGVYRRFGLCRCCLRKYAMLGIIPGLRKASST